MSGYSNQAREVLFGEEAGESPNEVLGLDKVLEAAEAEYDARGEEGESVDLVEYDEATPGSDEDAGAGGELDESGDDEDPEDSDEDDPTDDDDDSDDDESDVPSLRYKDQLAAEKAAFHFREQFNKTQWELEQLRQQAAAAPVAQPVEAPQDLAAMVAQNPVEGFGVALQYGDKQAASAAIARIQADAARMAASAAISRDEGDEETALEWDERVMSAAQLAEQFRQDLIRSDYEAQVEAQVEPFRREAVMVNAQAAAESVFSSELFEDIDVAHYDSEIGSYLQQYPHIMGDRSRSALEQAYRVAATAVIFGSHEAATNWIVEKRIAAQQAEAPVAKPKARGIAGGTGRSAPKSGGVDESQRVQQSIGGSEIPNGFDVFFGG